jgi:hypothetical protein
MSSFSAISWREQVTLDEMMMTFTAVNPTTFVPYDHDHDDPKVEVERKFNMTVYNQEAR